MTKLMINLKKNEQGQAIFEFIVFVPFMLMFYAVIINIYGAINGSINQQKATRGYLYTRMSNDSMVPDRPGLMEPSLKYNTSGMYVLGWKEKTQGGGDEGEPIATCYKVTSLFLSDESKDEKCEVANNADSSQFIRIQTVYGICGATYTGIMTKKFRLAGDQASSKSCMSLAN